MNLTPYLEDASRGVIAAGFANVRAECREDAIAVFGDCPCGLGTSTFGMRLSLVAASRMKCGLAEHIERSFHQMAQQHIEVDRREGRWQG